ncbi:PLP-dependent transferase [Candidatus Bathyarchaeota archaeon]|nr:PLP-dependent transferase [Candidatus Bathyarchaeota archaeon]
MGFARGSFTFAHAMEEQMHGFGGKPTSLGGVDTIATIPYISTHGGMSREEKMGVTSLVRASVGIEGFKDLKQDFENALSYV